MGALNFNDTRARPGPCILKKFDLENLCKEVRVWYVGSLSDGLLQLFCSYSANLTHLFTKPESGGAVHRPLKIVRVFFARYETEKRTVSRVFSFVLSTIELILCHYSPVISHLNVTSLTRQSVLLSLGVESLPEFRSFLVPWVIFVSFL